MPHKSIVTTTPDTYAPAGMLSPTQSVEFLWLAIALVFIGLAFIEGRSLARIASARTSRIARRFIPRTLRENR